MDIFVAMLAGLIAGITGAMGLGGGTVFLLYLTVFANVPQLRAQGMNILFFLSSAVVAVIVYSIKKQIDWRTVLPMAGLASLGSLAGAVIIRFIDAELLSKFFAVFILAMGVRELFAKVKDPNKESGKQ